MREPRGDGTRVGGFGLALALGMGMLAGCGGATATSRPTSASYTPDPIDPPAFLLAYAQAHDTPLVAPEGDLEALNAARRDASNAAERRAALADLAVYHALAAEQTEDPDEVRVELRKADRLAAAAVRHSHDEDLEARMDFVRLWASWRAGRADAATKAEAYTSRHTDPTDAVLLAWLVRGEIAFDADQWEEARAAYRYLLGQLGHPLYAYALFRSAIAYRNAGELDEAAQAFTEVRTLGCAADAAPETVRVASVAAVELGERVELDASGTPRSAACASVDDPSGQTGPEEPPPVVLE